MSEANTKYSRGKIYTIRNHLTDDVYVGSTINSLSGRLSGHKSDSKKKQKMELHKLAFKIGWEHFYIELYEEYPCENKNQLERREGEVIRQLNSSLNKVVAGRTAKEWYQDNKESVIVRTRKYYAERKDEINQKRRHERLDNPEKYRERDKKRDRKGYSTILRQRDLEKFRQKDRERYQKRKEYLKEKIECECGKFISRQAINKHRKRHNVKPIKE